MDSTPFLAGLLKIFSILSWPSFTLACPMYASFWAMESNSFSRNQQCLTFWVVFAIFTSFEPVLSRLPSWPYVKGVAMFLLVIPYFRIAAYVYKHFIRPYLSGNQLIWSFLFIPRNKCSSFSVQDSFVDEDYKNSIKEGQKDLNNAIFQGIFEHSHDNAKSEDSWLTTPNKVQKEWSCALVTTSSEKCLRKHLKGKKHKAEEDILRAEQLGMSVTHNSSFVVKQNNRMVLIENWVNVEKLTGLISPVARSIRWCRWKKPDIGWIKLNTDGSISRENAGFGGLLRKHDGDAICAFVSKAPFGDDIFLVELWGIWRGLILASSLGVKAIWVESDSESVVKTINRKQPYNEKARNCVKRIWVLLKKFKKYKVSHSWRESNKAADYLSKMVLDRNDVVLWPTDFPNGLCSIIKDDAHGRRYGRR